MSAIIFEGKEGSGKTTVLNEMLRSNEKGAFSYVKDDAHLLSPEEWDSIPLEGTVVLVVQHRNQVPARFFNEQTVVFNTDDYLS